MSMDSIRSALLTWMTRETGLTCIFPKQGEPRPPLPYGTLEFINPSGRYGGIDETRISGSDVTLHGLRSSNVSLNIFGGDANDRMSKLRDTLDLQRVIDEFNAAGIAHNGETGPNDLSSLMETKYQERSQMDLDISYSIELDQGIGIIEEVVITNENTNETVVITD